MNYAQQEAGEKVGPAQQEAGARLLGTTWQGDAGWQVSDGIDEEVVEPGASAAGLSGEMCTGKGAAWVGSRQG